MRNLGNSVQTIHFSFRVHMYFMEFLLFLFNSNIHIVYFLTTKQVAGDNRFVLKGRYLYLPFSSFFLIIVSTSFCAKGLDYVKTG